MSERTLSDAMGDCLEALRLASSDDKVKTGLEEALNAPTGKNDYYLAFLHADSSRSVTTTLGRALTELASVAMKEAGINDIENKLRKGEIDKKEEDGYGVSIRLPPEEHAGFIAALDAITENINKTPLLQKQFDHGLSLAARIVNRVPSAKAYLMLDNKKERLLLQTVIPRPLKSLISLALVDAPDPVEFMRRIRDENLLGNNHFAIPLNAGAFTEKLEKSLEDAIGIYTREPDTGPKARGGR